MTTSKIFQILFSLVAISSNMNLQASSDSEVAWNLLLKDNLNFVNNPKYIEERARLVNGQNPPYIVLSCSDSRAPPEIIFDQGLGSFFIPRVAGNIADDVVIDSMEFAVSHFDVSTIVVMGHEKCGAVIGALNRLRKNNGEIDPIGSDHFINAVLVPIEIAIVESSIDIYAAEALELSIRANVCYVAKQLLIKSRVISNAVSEGKLIIVGAEYSLETGRVSQLFILD